MRRLGVFLAGLLVALVALEACLRLVGSVYGVMENHGRLAPVFHDRNTKVILCLGNSYTKGAGASAGMGYPEQLQRSFDLQGAGPKVVVINEGLGAQSTAELLTDLTPNLDKWSPDLVVLQTGQANQWNYIGYEDPVRNKSGFLSWSEVVRGSWVHLLYRSRVYRLLVLVEEHLKKRLSSEGPFFEDMSDEAYRDAVQYVISLMSPYRELGSKTFDPERFLKARRVLLRAVEKKPKYSFNYILVGDTYRLRGEFEQAFSWYVQSLRVDPERRKGDVLHRGYQALRDLRDQDKGTDSKKLNERIDDFIEDFEKKNGEGTRLFLSLDARQIRAWIESDTRKIIRTLQTRKIPCLIQNYPVETLANDVLREAAERHSIPFVDNKKVFEEEMSRGVRWEDLFVPDGHCNDRGYHLMAGNVYRKIVDEKLLG